MLSPWNDHGELTNMREKKKLIKNVGGHGSPRVLFSLLSANSHSWETYWGSFPLPSQRLEIQSFLLLVWLPPKARELNPPYY